MLLSKIRQAPPKYLWQEALVWRKLQAQASLFPSYILSQVWGITVSPPLNFLWFRNCVNKAFWGKKGLLEMFSPEGLGVKHYVVYFCRTSQDFAVV